MRRTVLSLGLAAGCGWLAHSRADPVGVGLVRYPRPTREFDEANWYPLLLLRAALRASGAQHQIEPSLPVMGQSRTLIELEQATGLVDVGWAMTSRARERALLPVRIPLHKGLFGWRLLLVRPERQEAFAQVRRLEDLRAFRLAQGTDWPDTAVLRANGLQVVTSSSYEQLFDLLLQGRVDAFPRAVAEIWWELDRRGQPLAVEPHLALRYPAPIYFFVPPRRRDLAVALERGLRRLLQEGEFETLFQRQHADALKRSHLASRRVLDLRNPDMPAQTPVAESGLWHRP